MDGETRVDVNGTDIEIEKVEKPKGKRKTSLKEKTKKLNAESTRDAIGIYFAEGGRVDESSFNTYGDPNFIKDNPSIRKNYTNKEGEPIDIIAKRISEEFGVDEQAVVQEIVDFISGKESTGDVVAEMESRSNLDAPVESDYIIKPISSKSNPSTIVPVEVSSGLSPRENSELEGWISQFTEEGALNADDLVQTIGDKEFATEFLGMSERVYDSIQDMTTSKGKSNPVSESVHNVGEEIEAADHSDNGFISKSVMGLKIGGKSLSADILPLLRKFYKLTFTAKGLLNSSLDKLNKGRVSRINAQMKRVSRLNRKLERLVNDHYGNAAPNAMKGIKILLENKEFIDASVIDGKPIEIDQAGPVTDEIMEVIAEMRAHVDGLSAELVALGVVDGPLAIDILENQGTYLTRSYKIHDDKDWVSKVRDTAVWNRAKDLIRRQSEAALTEFKKAKATYVEKMKKSKSSKVFWMDKIRAIDKAIAKMEKRIANQNGELDGEVEAIVRDQTQASTSNVAKKGKLGSKDLGVLSQRKLPPELRDLFGEYEDPLMVYSKSIYKQIHLLENFIFLRSVEDAGLSEGWLKDQADKDHHVKLASDQSKTMSPLNGYYTTPVLAEAFDTYNENWTADFIGKALFPLMKLSSTAKYMKTILSPVTQVRNFVFNVFFHV